MNRVSVVASCLLAAALPCAMPAAAVADGSIQQFSYDLRETILLPSNLCAIAVADMDGDTNVDILVGGPFRVMEADGTNVACRATIPGLRTPVVADADGDGRAEIMVATPEGHVDIWKATANDQYELVHTENLGYFMENAVAGDSDGNGRRELLIAQESFPSRVVILESATNGFVNRGSLAGLGGDCRVAGAYDLDGDGAAEVVFHDNRYRPGAPNTLYVYETNSLVFQEDGQSALCLGDTDGNGRGEIVGFASATGNLRMLESTGSAHGFVEVFNAPAGGYSPYGVDLDGDGRMELWRSSPVRVGTTNYVTLAAAYRSGGTLVPMPIEAPLFPDGTGRIVGVFVLGDLNADGYPDMALTQFSGRVHVLVSR